MNDRILLKRDRVKANLGRSKINFTTSQIGLYPVPKCGEITNMLWG